MTQEDMEKLVEMIAEAITEKIKAEFEERLQDRSFIDRVKALFFFIRKWLAGRDEENIRSFV